MSQVERGSPFKSISKEGRNLHKQMEGCSENDAVDQAINTEAGHEENCPENLTDIIQNGRKRRKKKMLIGLQACHHKPADGKDDSTDEIQSHEFCKQLTLLCTEPRRNANLRVHDWLSKNGNEDGNGTRHDKSQVCDARKQIPRLGAPFGREIVAHQGDKRHGQCAARNERK